jgi:hypothetical protein
MMAVSCMFCIFSFLCSWYWLLDHDDILWLYFYGNLWDWVIVVVDDRRDSFYGLCCGRECDIPYICIHFDWVSSRSSMSRCLGDHSECHTQIWLHIYTQLDHNSCVENGIPCTLISCYVSFGRSKTRFDGEIETVHNDLSQLICQPQACNCIIFS